VASIDVAPRALVSTLIASDGAIVANTKTNKPRIFMELPCRNMGKGKGVPVVTVDDDLDRLIHLIFNLQFLIRFDVSKSKRKKIRQICAFL
jgi:hypothetical protein